MNKLVGGVVRPACARILVPGLWLLALVTLCCVQPAAAVDETFAALKLPRSGDHELHILSPTCLELIRVNTKPSNSAPVDSWDWVNGQGQFVPPDTSSVRVIINGQTNSIVAVGFKRRPVHVELWSWDIRIANYLYFTLGTPVQPGQAVRVINDGSLWPDWMEFAATANPLRYSPAIHVNQEGYVPGFPKKAMVGYYLGSLGEMALPTTTFSIVSSSSGAPVYQGTLTVRPDTGYLYTPTPYQSVYEADFSAFTVPGQYRLLVPGLGASYPFQIGEGLAMDFARTYALGVFHQRSGFNVAMPYTRFTHAADHLAPASVPVDTSDPYVFTWNRIAYYASQVNPDNPPQIAPPLTSPGAQLYPYVNPGPVDLAGGHFEAANYSKVTWNMAQVIHVLLYAVDAIPGVAALDNLGLPESGDGISDVLQEAKWEADALVKMQDADGGFYYMMYPQYREYEGDVLPENGDPQVVWPKNTATTAAAVAALAACSSSPKFKQAYPAAAANYWATALRGWQFLTNAIAAHGLPGAYQRIMHFDDTFTHMDELSWAACELFLATGDQAFHTQLKTWFPDPTDPSTMRWGWIRMYACYGNAVRSYSAAVKSGRLQASQLDSSYLAKCIQTLTDCGNDNLLWSQQNAYGTSFAEATKHVRNAGWYFSLDQAFEMVVAQQFSPNPAYLDAILRNLNYEAGCNPVNVAYLTGLGWKRQRTVVDQYSANDRRVLPKIGWPLGNIQAGFGWTWTYGGLLDTLSSPSDGADTAPYPFYDRWSDFWNVSTEASTSSMVRSYAALLWLAAQTSLAAQPWTWTNATILAPGDTRSPGQPFTVTLQVADPNLAGARITWEARDQEPAFGGLSYTFVPVMNVGPQWIEAEVQWPDGRRAFAMQSVNVGSAVSIDPPQLRVPQINDPLGFSLVLAGVPGATYVIRTSGDLAAWTDMATITLPATGAAQVWDPRHPTLPGRYYRAVKMP